MEMTEWMVMTPEQRMDQAGDEPQCPYCQKPRVQRSSYIRCNKCGMNWAEGQDIFKHPHMKVTSSTTLATKGTGAQTANATLSDCQHTHAFLSGIDNVCAVCNLKIDS